MTDMEPTSLEPHPRLTVVRTLAPGRFVAAPTMTLELTEENVVELPWELFHGRLLGDGQTRERRRFLGWNVYARTGTGESAPWFLSVLLEVKPLCLHVTRSLRCYVWEGYDAGDNVFRSREVQRWVRELVATLPLPPAGARQHLARDLEQALFRAVVGLSRLPLTSLEAPLPDFTLGKLGYFPLLKGRATARPIEPGLLALAPRMRPPERVKLLELLLRGVPDVGALAAAWQALGKEADLAEWLLAVFDETALSPWTDFVERTLTFLRVLHERGALAPAVHVDFLGKLLRRLGRHLTAFDLVTFHHRGANYPDALLLDAMLKAYLRLAEQHGELFTTGADALLRRRALRQGWLLRRRYEGHPVPAVPTSPGENQRVLPPEFPHLDDQDILDPTRRKQELFAGDPIEAHLPPAVQALLAASLEDLQQPAELRELGTALFLDRPLGVGRHPTEPDQTTLLSYVAFSATVAADRLHWLVRRGLIPAVTPYQAALAQLAQEGVPLARQPLPARAGVPSLQDAFRIAPDFVLRATTGRSAGDFFEAYDLTPLAAVLPLDWLQASQRRLIVGGGAVADQPITAVTLFDENWQRRAEFTYDPRGGYRTVGLIEHPAEGLQLVRTWEKTDSGWQERRWEAENMRVDGRA